MIVVPLAVAVPCEAADATATLVALVVFKVTTVALAL